MISSGFFNSIKHDRRYNALQFGSIYDGVIRDGIFMSIGTCFQITEADPRGMEVIIGAGRAWFDHSWILNDAPEALIMPQSELLLDRIDAVVIETNWDEKVRRNCIKVVSGEPSTNPKKPVLIRSATVNQYPLAYVTIKADSTYIRQANIENTVGSEPCPFVTGILETVDTTILVAQWKDEWEIIKEQFSLDWENWYTAKLEEIQNWYEFIKDTLGEDAAVGLANKLYDLQQQLGLMDIKIDRVIEETLEEVDTQLQGLIKENLSQSAEIQKLRNDLSALSVKVDNAISGGSLAPPINFDFIYSPYITKGWAYDASGGETVFSVNSNTQLEGYQPERREYKTGMVTRTYSTKVKINNNKAVFKYNVARTLQSRDVDEIPYLRVRLLNAAGTTLFEDSLSSRVGTLSGSIPLTNYFNQEVYPVVDLATHSGDVCQFLIKFNTLSIT